MKPLVGLAYFLAWESTLEDSVLAHDQRQARRRRPRSSAAIIATLLLGAPNGRAAAQCEMEHISALDVEQQDRFGTSVALYGDLMVVGASLYDGNESFSGAAYIYRAESPNWCQDTVLFTSDGQQFDLFGTSVSTDAFAGQ